MKKFLLALFICLFTLTSCNDNKMVIELEENPTTGYVWTFSQEGDGSVELIKDEYKADKEIIGSGGVHSFTFKAENDGVCFITFEHKRPWLNEYLERKVYKLEISNGKFIK